MRIDRQRMIILAILSLVFVGATSVYFVNVWNDSQTRFRTGLPVPRNILPTELLSQEELIAEATPTPPNVQGTEPLLFGTPGSPTTIILYGDFQSELSKQQSAVIQSVLTELSATQKIRVVWKDLPVTIQHSKALPAAIAGRCAHQQDAFKEMHDLLFTKAESYDEEEMKRFARILNIQEQDFLLCLRDPAHVFRIERDIEDAQLHGVREVPAMFVNDQYLGGFADEQSLKTILKFELLRVRTP